MKFTITLLFASLFSVNAFAQEQVFPLVINGTVGSAEYRSAFECQGGTISLAAIEPSFQYAIASGCALRRLANQHLTQYDGLALIGTDNTGPAVQWREAVYPTGSTANDFLAFVNRQAVPVVVHLEYDVFTLQPGQGRVFRNLTPLSTYHISASDDVYIQGFQHMPVTMPHNFAFVWPAQIVDDPVSPTRRTIPTKPSNLAAVCHGATVTLNWEPAIGADYYQVWANGRLNGGPADYQLASTQDTHVTIPVRLGELYDWVIWAKNELGESFEQSEFKCSENQ